MRFLTNKIRHKQAERGFTLMNALLTASLGVVLVFMMTKGLMTAYDSQSKISGVGQIDNLTASLNLLLSEDALCKNAFRNSSTTTDILTYSTTEPMVIPHLYMGEETLIASSGEEIGKYLLIDSITLRDSGITADTGIADFEGTLRKRYFATLDFKIKLDGGEGKEVDLTPVRLSILTDNNDKIVGCSTNPELM